MTKDEKEEACELLDLAPEHHTKEEVKALMDDRVHDIFSDKASNVNNDGIAAQIELVREEG